MQPFLTGEMMLIKVFFIFLALATGGHNADVAISSNMINTMPQGKPMVIIAYNSYMFTTLNMHINSAPSAEDFFKSGVKTAMENGLMGYVDNNSKVTEIVGNGIDDDQPTHGHQKEPHNEFKSSAEVELVTPTSRHLTSRAMVSTNLTDDLCRVCNDRFKPHVMTTTERGDQGNDIAMEAATSKPSSGGSIFAPTIGRYGRSIDVCKTLADQAISSFTKPIRMNISCPNCALNLQLIPEEPSKNPRMKRSAGVQMTSLTEAMKTQEIGQCPFDMVSENSIHRSVECQHWLTIRWNDKERNFCVHHESCGAGQYLSGGVCKITGLNTVQSSVCSDHIFRISSHPVVSSSTVPEFDDPMVCEVMGHKLRKCRVGVMEMRRISVIGFNGKEHLVTAHHDFTSVENLASPMNYICTGCSPASCSNCKGDVYYKSNFATDESGICRCQLKSQPKFGTVSIVLGGLSYPVEYYVTQFLSVGMKVKPGVELPSVLFDCPTCSSTCVGNTLSLSSYPDDAANVKVCSGSLCKASPFRNEITISPHFLMIQNIVQVTIYGETGAVIQDIPVTCAVTASCDLIKCHLCFSKILNPACYDPLDSALLLVGLVFCFCFITIIFRLLSSMLVLLQIIQLVIKVVATILKALIRAFRSFCGYGVRQTKTIYRKIEQVGEGETIEVITEKREEVVERSLSRQSRLMTPGERRVVSEMMPLVANKSTNFHRPGLIIMIISLGFALQLVSGCSQVNHINLKDDECEIASDKVVCVPTAKVIFNLGGSGADACVLASKGETVMGSLQIRISSIRSRCVPTFLYWTYEYSSHIQTECLCNTLNRCSNNCSASASKVSKSILNDLQIKHNTGPGRSGCLEVPNHYLGACVLPMNTCCFFVSEMPPVLPIRAFKVEVCSTYVWEVEVVLKTFFSDLSVESKHTLTAGEEVTKDSVKLLLTQVSSPVIPSQNGCFATEEGKDRTYLIECNKEGEMVAGKFGSIKCKSLEQIKENPSNCTHSNNMMSIVPGSNSLYATVNKLDMTKLLSGKALPLDTPGFSVGKDNRGFYFKRSFSEVFSIQLSLPSMTALVYSKLATCNLIHYSLKGCFSCMEGAIASFHAVCSATPVIGSLRCPSLPGPIPVVINTKGNFTLKLSFSRAIIDEVCNYTLGKTSGHFSLKGNLIELAKVDDEFAAETTNSKGASPGLLDGLSGTLSSAWRVVQALLSSLWTSIWFGLLILAGLGITILLFRILWNTKTSKVELDLKRV